MVGSLQYFIVAASVIHRHTVMRMCACGNAAVAGRMAGRRGSDSMGAGWTLGVQLSTLVVMQSTQSGGTFSTLVLRRSVVLVLGYSYSVVLSSDQLKP